MKTSKETLELLKENGYESLDDYLQCLAEDYNVDYSTVKSLYYVLGDSELFDGLVCAVEDASVGY